MTTHQNALSPLKPPLKWAGGKRWLVPRLARMWQPYAHHRLIEPFCGGLAITLGLMPQTALLNDNNHHLINFYRHLKSTEGGFQIDDVMESTSDFYYAARQEFNDLIRAQQANSPRAAALFYYLNRTGYNGLSRFNNRDEFNVPFGKYKRINYTRNFAPYQAAFANWDFSTGDFERIDISDHDFIYADPPYDVPFTKYNKEDFTWHDQVRLAIWLSQQRCPVVTSNQATDRIITLYADLGFDVSIVSAPRRISCTGDRSNANEILATRNLTPQ